jgi:hypothetical protein
MLIKKPFKVGKGGYFTPPVAAGGGADIILLYAFIPTSFFLHNSTGLGGPNFGTLIEDALCQE